MPCHITALTRSAINKTTGEKKQTKNEQKQKHSLPQKFNI